MKISKQRYEAVMDVLHAAEAGRQAEPDWKALGEQRWREELGPPEGPSPPAQAVPPEEIIRNLLEENARLRRFREKTEIELERVWLQRTELERENGRLRNWLGPAEEVCRAVGSASFISAGDLGNAGRSHFEQIEAAFSAWQQAAKREVDR